jgi:hypothetical protein
MTDFDTIWRKQDEIRTVINAVLGECIWNLGYSERRMAIELELTRHLDEEEAGELSCQFPLPCDYNGEGARGTKFIFYQ